MKEEVALFDMMKGKERYSLRYWTSFHFSAKQQNRTRPVLQAREEVKTVFANRFRNRPLPSFRFE